MRQVMCSSPNRWCTVVPMWGIPEMSPYTVDPVKGTVYGYTAPPKLVSSTNTHEVEEVKLIHVMLCQTFTD
jgi:hypothetical protein